jgi:hypothetical protein
MVRTLSLKIRLQVEGDKLVLLSGSGKQINLGPSVFASTINTSSELGMQSVLDSLLNFFQREGA